MIPENFDEQVRRQLGKREIKPSAESWEKLEVRLEHKKKKPVLHFWWIGGAAAIAVIFFTLGTFFQNPAAEGPSVVIEEPSKEKFKITETPEEIIIAAEDLNVPETPVTQKIESLPEKNTAENTFSKTLALTDPVPQTLPQKEEEEVAPQMIDETRAGNLNTTEVSDAEVEALLQKAGDQLRREQAYAVKTVNAERLLDEVEYELEQNFRHKVFEVLKEGFTKAKTAVANRNH
ncbi:hypothetical protein [Salinimicrobium flavum]|uniref:Anti-sigma factor n=1 Tax=Salinimicrobium flavum TaxID=1737065 RepID=A0ABW5IU24_9FLAO